MSGSPWLRLARVSNLPTVWTNGLAGMVLAGAEPGIGRALLLLVALSLFYTGGMILNDAFDHRIDARERPGRPIPSGAVAVEAAFATGFLLLLLGLALVLLAAQAMAPATGWPPLLAGMALAVAIVLYDWHHKANPLSPLMMALCRLLAYLVAGYAAAVTVAPGLWLVALVGACHVTGLTYIARQETLARLEHLWPLAPLAVPLLYGLWLATGGALAAALWLGLAACVALALFWLRRRGAGDVGRAVVTMIAAIALLDGLFLAAAGRADLALVAGLCFAATLALQRWVRGT
jgi:4-hydroxybenzoate polyprenyltransferase